MAGHYLLLCGCMSLVIVLEFLFKRETIRYIALSSPSFHSRHQQVEILITDE